MNRRVVIALIAGLVPYAFMAGRWTARLPESRVVAAAPAESSALRLSPVAYAEPIAVTVTTGSEVGIPLLPENTSDQPIRYAAWKLKRNGEDVFGFNVASFHDGQPADNLGRRETEEALAPLAEDVRELAPGHGVVHTLRPLRDFADFDPGEYELRVTYAIPAGPTMDTELGLTVMSLTRTIRLKVESKP